MAFADHELGPNEIHLIARHVATSVVTYFKNFETTGKQQITYFKSGHTLGKIQIYLKDLLSMNLHLFIFSENSLRFRVLIT